MLNIFHFCHTLHHYTGITTTEVIYNLSIAYCTCDGVNLLAEHTNTIRKMTHTSKEDGLAVNAQKTEYMFMNCLHSVQQNNNIKTSNNSFKNVAELYI
jgi:hypothetical protein